MSQKENESNDINVNVDVKNLPEIERLSKKIAELEISVKEKDRVIADQWQAIEKIEFEKKEKDIDVYLNAKASEGKITPAQREDFKTLMIDEKFEKFFKNDIVKRIIENSSVVNFSKAESVASEIVRETYNSDNDIDDDKFHEKVLKYSKENQITYREAYSKLAQGGK